MEKLLCELKFSALREANIARLPEFKNKHGELAHSRPDGSDWTPAQWLQAAIGELGEYANKRKKFERGDITAEKFAVEAAKELADVVVYLDLLAMRCLDTVEEEWNPVAGKDGWSHTAHPTGIDLGRAVLEKFNEVSERVGTSVRLKEHQSDEREYSDHGKRSGLVPKEGIGGDAP